MRKVVHVGPCNSPGGMATVMKTLAEHPPEGWKAELLASHVVGSSWDKWRVYRKARSTFIRMLNDPMQRPDVVHLHTAADWSWWRKRRFALLAHAAGCKIVVHIHSGKFDQWLGKGNRAKKLRARLEQCNATIVCLSDRWKELLTPLLGRCKVSLNPIDPIHCISDSVKRVPNQLLLLGRNDAVKGHEFAFEIMRELQEKESDIVLHCTGVEQSPEDLQNVVAHGWLEQEKKVELLQQSSLLILPSKWEGQPMVALEALACGTPVLASDSIHSLPEMVEKCSMDEVSLWGETISSLLKTNQQGTASGSVEDHLVTAVQTNLLAIYDQLW